MRCILFRRAGNKGYAYTFLTPEQERCAGDIVRAFELSGVPVPDQLRILWDQYRAKQAAVSIPRTRPSLCSRGYK